MKPRFARALIVLWAVVAATFPGALGIAHAVQSAGSAAAASSHVEPLGGQDCAAVHDAECGRCANLRIAGVGAAPAVLPLGGGRTPPTPRAGTVRPASADPGGGARPRAPPIL